jgi:hypothetical protein
MIRKPEAPLVDDAISRRMTPSAASVKATIVPSVLRDVHAKEFVSFQSNSCAMP